MRPGTVRITITSINLRFMGETHSLAGREVKGGTFELALPFQNKIGSGLLPDMLKGPGLTLSSIEVSPPFTLLGISPKLPQEVAYMQKVVFRLMIKAPEVAYEGPLAVSFGNEPGETVNLNISSMVLEAKGTKVVLEDSAIVANMQKGQIFKRSVQLYKILGYQDTLSSISVSSPFELVSTDPPELPIRLDRKDSYIISLFIKAPDSSYAGTLEIEFK